VLHLLQLKKLLKLARFVPAAVAGGCYISVSMSA
jgi:hypothetical protein